MTQKYIKETITTPRCYQICLLSDCPMAEECIRYFAGLHIDKDEHSGFATYPTALKGSKCEYFKKKRIIQGAWGFHTIFKDVKRCDSASLHNAIKQYLGGNGTYYRYDHGERILTPEQQNWIINLFKQYGYTDNLEFDGDKEVYDW
ncbi:MAG: DUF6078 family protein [Prevotella sp.]|nr:DUF6078 family protein [Prevotella sp.]